MGNHPLSDVDWNDTDKMTPEQLGFRFCTFAHREMNEWAKEFQNKNDWLPAILISIPISHIEIPFEDVNDVKSTVGKYGYQVEVTEW